MSRSSTLVLLGVLTMLAPLSGFPSSFRTLFSVVIGACVMGIGLAMRTRPAPLAAEAESPEELVVPSTPKGVSPI